MLLNIFLDNTDQIKKQIQLHAPGKVHQPNLLYMFSSLLNKRKFIAGSPVPDGLIYFTGLNYEDTSYLS